MTSEEIKVSVSMQEIVRQYNIPISRQGFICCQFHKENTASMKIYEDSYFCFGCGAAGDIFSFVQQVENCTFKEAFLKLGGTYQNDKSTLRGRIQQYKIQKNKSTSEIRKSRLIQERKVLLREIKTLSLCVRLYPPLSDDWSECYNLLQLRLYRLDFLNEKR